MTEITDPFTIPAEEVDRRLALILGWLPSDLDWFLVKVLVLPDGTLRSKPIHSDDNAMRLVRAEILKRKLQRSFMVMLGHQISIPPSTSPWELDWIILDAPTDLQARCALKVLEEAIPPQTCHGCGGKGWVVV